MRTAYSCLESEDIAVIRHGWTAGTGDDQLKQSQRKEKRYGENSKREKGIKLIAVNGSYLIYTARQTY